MNHEIWDERSGNLIFSSPDYDEAFRWLWDLWKSQGDDALTGLSMNVKKPGHPMEIVVRDHVLKYILADMPASGPDVKRDEDATQRLEHPEGAHAEPASQAHEVRPPGQGSRRADQAEEEVDR